MKFRFSDEEAEKFAHIITKIGGDPSDRCIRELENIVIACFAYPDLEETTIDALKRAHAAAVETSDAFNELAKQMLKSMRRDIDSAWFLNIDYLKNVRKMAREAHAWSEGLYFELDKGHGACSEVAPARGRPIDSTLNSFARKLLKHAIYSRWKFIDDKGSTSRYFTDLAVDIIQSARPLGVNVHRDIRRALIRSISVARAEDVADRERVRRFAADLDAVVENGQKIRPLEANCLSGAPQKSD